VLVRDVEEGHLEKKYFALGLGAKYEKKSQLQFIIEFIETNFSKKK